MMFLMRFEPGNIYFNKVYIVQSLREGDRRTGDELYNDIIRWRTSESLVAELRDVTTKEELVSYLKKIFDHVTAGLFPLIHFETHGYEAGIQLASGEEVNWRDLVPYFRAINSSTKNNLFISVAACQGGSIQFCVNITEPSPFRGFIGPMQDVKEEDVLNSFSGFFNIMLLENDVEKGIEALNSTSGLTKYHHMNTEHFFEIVWNNNQNAWERDTNKKRDLVEYILDEQIRRNPNLVLQFGSRRKLRKSIKEFVENDRPKVMEILRKQFCHIN
jgi:hypothetical protein